MPAILLVDQCRTLLSRHKLESADTLRRVEELDRRAIEGAPADGRTGPGRRMTTPSFMTIKLVTATPASLNGPTLNGIGGMALLPLVPGRLPLTSITSPESIPLQ